MPQLGHMIGGKKMLGLDEINEDIFASPATDEELEGVC